MALLRKSNPANATGPRDPRTYRDPKPHKDGVLPPKIPGELVPKHVAIVMDGNGRWAKQRGLSRTQGHEVGEKSLFDVVEGAVQIGVTHISAYAFSTENWKRSPEEVRWRMAFNRLTIRRRIDEMDELGVRIRWSGRRPRLWKSVIDELEIAEERTKDNTRFTLNMCVNYGGRAEIAAAAALAKDAAAGKINPNRIDEKLFAKYLDEPDLPDVDLFLRSSGEQRTSNFMRWRAAYAEMVFLDTLWPDFDRTHLWQAIQTTPTATAASAPPTQPRRRQRNTHPLRTVKTRELMPQLTPPDGRQLEYQDFGPPDARPLLFAHSTPGSGFALQAVEHAATELGLRLITWSRPGYGTSTRQPERTVAAHAAEVESILDHLGAPRCLIAGWDGGGPHALAAAALIPARIEAALTISGLAPLAANAYLLRTMHEHRQEELAAAALGETALRSYLSAHVTTALSGIPLTDTDRAALAPPTTADLFHNYQHGLTFGLDGWVDDDLALTRLWGFDPSRIGVPVHIWHGSDDYQVPYAHSWLLAAVIPTATTHIEPDHGHLFLMLGHLPAMLAALMQDAR